MARKSRKNVEVSTSKSDNTLDYNVGAYVRLSAVDRKHKGDSIETQKSIIAAYIAECPDLKLTEIYIDNGLTGQTFERPAFQRMLSDFESGKINCCVTKDLSRLGRNAIDTGYYIEKYFPTHGIRFIAINDDYDSADGNSGGIMVSLKNMVNEHYALEIGRKVQATKQMNIRAGCFVGRIPPYGYLKSKDDSHKLVPDEYAAQIVRRIFEMAADGQAVGVILRWLNDGGILPPRQYFYSIGLVTEKEASGHIHWSKNSIYYILRNRIYIGDMVQGKRINQHHVLKRVPPSEWVITEDTHEPVVSRELFATVQKSWKKLKQPVKKLYKNPKTDNILLRKVFCAHCGYTMHRVRKSETQYIFRCKTSQLYGIDVCTVSSIDEDALKTEIIKRLRGQSDVLIHTNEQKPLIQSDNSKLRDIQEELKHKKHFFKSLYESRFDDGITYSEYKEMKHSYETRIEVLTEQERELKEKARLAVIETEAKNKVADNINSIVSAADLTAEIVDRLIGRILVSQDKQIEVQFKCKDTAGGQVV